MKYYDINFKNDSNNDELENSIVDSLSEISIASNLPISIQTQDLINKTVSDVISTYLWSNDAKEQPNYKRSKKYKNINEFEHEKEPVINYIANSHDRQTKTSWDKIDNEPAQIINRKTSLGIISPDENSDDSLKQSPKKSSTKISTNQSGSSVQTRVPTLDFSYLQDQKLKIENEDLRKDKNNNKQKTVSHDNQLFLNKQDNSKITMNTDSNKPLFKRTIQNETSNHHIKSEIETLLKELKLSKNQSSDINDYYDQDNESKLSKADNDKLYAMAVNLKELLSRLLEKRKLSKRNTNPEKMTKEEIQAEKIDTQKELLTFEEKHGRPQTKMEKDLMRPLYDHYRKVKRLLSKVTGKANGSVNEAHENDNNDDEDNLKDHKHFLNLHSLSLVELSKEKENSMLEKTRLKDLIKKYENEFAKTNGRPLTKEDREYHKEDFEKYKIIKAKLKLIDALIEKHESSKK